MCSLQVRVYVPDGLRFRTQGYLESQVAQENGGLQISSSSPKIGRPHHFGRLRIQVGFWKSDLGFRVWGSRHGWASNIRNLPCLAEVPAGSPFGSTSIPDASKALYRSVEKSCTIRMLLRVQIAPHVEIPVNPQPCLESHPENPKGPKY